MCAQWGVWAVEVWAGWRWSEQRALTSRERRGELPLAGLENGEKRVEERSGLGMTCGPELTRMDMLGRGERGVVKGVR